MWATIGFINCSIYFTILARFLCSFTLGVNNFQHISASYHEFSAVVQPISWLYHCFLSISTLFQWKCMYVCMYVCIYVNAECLEISICIYTHGYRVHLCMLYYMYIRIYIYVYVCVSKKDRKACVRFWPYLSEKHLRFLDKKL